MTQQQPYKFSGHYTASFQNLRDLNTQIRSDVLPKTGGVVTGEIYYPDNTDPLHALATKQYVLDNVGGGGGGGGSHPDKIESQDALKSTSVLCTTDGIQMSDNEVSIFQFQKHPTLAASILKDDQSQLRVLTDELLLRNKGDAQSVMLANQFGVTSYVPIALDPSVNVTTDDQLTNRGLVNSLITAAKNSVTQIIDKNTGEDPVTNAYRLTIDNNELQFYRGSLSDDMWLKFYATATDSTDGVIQQTNRSNYFLESSDTSSDLNTLYLRHTFNADPASLYQNTAPFRIQQGKDTDTGIPYSRISGMNLLAGGQNATINMTPKNTLTSTKNNYIEPTLRMGYSSGADLTTQNADSVLKRSENDSRYYLNTTPLNSITLAAADVDLNNKQLKRVSAATELTDGLQYGQLSAFLQGYSYVKRPNANYQGVLNTKVTGFNIENQSNQNRAYWDASNQCFLVSIPNGLTSINVTFTFRASWTINANNDALSLTLRDFTNNVNYDLTLNTRRGVSGPFTEEQSITLNFTTNRFVGLYVTALNGGQMLNMTMHFQAVAQYISTAIDRLADPTNASSISATGSGFSIDQTGRTFFFNGCQLYGSKPIDFNSDPDELVTKTYVDTQIAQSSYYVGRVLIGDVPSSVEGWSSTANLITDVIYTNASASSGWYTIYLSQSPFGANDYEVFVQVRSLRTGNPSTLDNDLSIPVVVNKNTSYFQVFLEETGSVGQNVAIALMIARV